MASTASLSPVWLAPDFSTTTPSTPATGATVFNRKRARGTLAWVDSMGHDTQVQPHAGSNKIVQVSAIPTNTLISATGTAPIFVSGGGSAPTAVTPATTNWFTRLQRFRLATAATAGSTASLRQVPAPWTISSLANAGGFDFRARFGLATGQAGHRIFVGLSSTVTSITTNADPSTFLANSIGVILDGADSNYSIYSSGATAGTFTKTALSGSFPGRNNQTNFYEFNMFIPPGSTSAVAWSMRHLSDGVTTNGVMTTNLPVVDTQLTYQAFINNGTAAATANLDIQSIYVESDN